MSSISNLSKLVDEWTAGGCPITMMMNMERRQGKDKPVIKKALVELRGLPFKKFAEARESWKFDDDYRCPGPIQFYGPAANSITYTMQYEIEQGGVENIH